MQESLVLFESIVNSRWFLSTSIILFLNKIDVFQNKISRSPLEKYYPEYQGGADVTKATKFILWKFVNMNRAKLALYPQYVISPAFLFRRAQLIFSYVNPFISQSNTSHRHEECRPPYTCGTLPRHI